MFTIANLIILIIAIGTPIIIRVFDKSNTSDKIKELNSQLKYELHSFVNQQALALKDIDSDISVREHIIKDMLTHIQNAQETIDNRHDQYKHIAHTLSEYDTKLATLSDAAHQTETAIAQLKNDSTFIAELHEKITFISEGLNILETRMPELLDNFETINQKQLEKNANFVMHNITEQITHIHNNITDLDNTVHAQQQHIDTYHAKLEHDMKNISDTYQEHVHNAQNQLYQLIEQQTHAHDMTITDISNTHIHAHEQLLEQEQAFQTLIEQQATHYVELITNHYHAMNTEYEEYIQNHHKKFMIQQQDFVTQQQLMTQTSADITAITENCMQQIAQQELSQKATIEEAHNTLSQLKNESHRITQDLNTHLEHITQQSDAISQAMTQEAHNTLSQLENETYRITQELNTHIEHITQQSDDVSQAMTQEAHNTLSQLENETYRITQDLNTHLEHITQNSDDIVKTMTQEAHSLHTFISDSQTHIQEQHNTMLSTLEQDFHLHSQKLTQQAQELQETNLDYIRNHIAQTLSENMDIFQTDINHYKHTYEAQLNAMQTLYSDHESTMNQVNTDLKSWKNSQNLTIENQLNTIKNELDSQLQHYIQHQEQHINASLDTLKTSLEHKIEHIIEKYNVQQYMTMLENTHDELSDFVNSYGELTHNLINSIQAQIDSDKERLNSWYTSYHDKIPQLFQTIEQELNEKLQTLESTQLSVLQNEMHERIAHTQNALELHIKDNETLHAITILDDLKKHYDESIENAHVFIDNTIKECKQNFETYKDAQFAQLHHNATEKFHSLDEHMQTFVDEKNEQVLHNIEQLEELIQQQIVTVNTQKQDIITQFDTVVRTNTLEFNTYIDSLNDQYEEIQNSLNTQLQTHNESLTRAHEHINNEITNYTHDHTGIIDMLHNELSEHNRYIDELQQKRTDLDDLSYKLDNTILSLTEEIQDNTAHIREHVMNNIESFFSEHEQKVLQRITDVEQRYSTAHSKFINLETQIDDTIRRFPQEAQEQINTLLIPYTRDIKIQQEQIDTLEHNITGLNVKFSEVKQRSYEKLNNMLSTFENTIRTDLHERTHALQEAIIQAKNELELQVLTVKDEETRKQQQTLLIYQQEAQKQCDTIINHTQAQLTDNTVRAQKYIDDLTTQTHNQLNQFHDTIHNDIQHTHDTALVLFDEAHDKIINYVTEQNTLLETQYNHNKELAHETQIMSDNTQQTLKTIKNEVSEYTQLTHAESILAYEKYQQLCEQLDDNIFNITEYKKELSQSMRKTRVALDEALEQIRTQYSTQTRSLITNFEDFRTYQIQKQTQQNEDFTHFENNMNERIDTQMTLLQTIEQQVQEYPQTLLHNITQEINDEYHTKKTELLQLLTDFNERIEIDFTAMQQNVNEIQTNVDEHINQKLHTIFTDIDMHFKSLEDRLYGEDGMFQELIQKAKMDVNTTQDEITEKITEIDKNVSVRILEMQTNLHTSVAEIREQFSRQKSELINAAGDGHRQLKNEIFEISNQVQRLKDDIDFRGKQAIEQFHREFQDLQHEAERYGKAFYSELENETKNIRYFVQSARDDMEETQKRLLHKFEADIQRVESQLERIDERQQNFTEQTKVFERADSLKFTLQQNITELQNEIRNLESDRREINEIEPRIVKLRRMLDDSNDKINRFMSEKRKIDTLGANFEKLLSISQVIDAKINDMEQNSDIIQQMQLSLRQIDDMERDIEERYERLENKRIILDEAHDGINISFERLTELEQEVQRFEQMMHALPQQVNELSSNMSTLLQDRHKINDVLKQATKLDKMIHEINNNMNTIQQSREWIAGIETRLTNLSQQTDKQLHLYHQIIQQNTTNAPSASQQEQTGIHTPEQYEQLEFTRMDSKQMVLHLAQQGWKVPEIAHATKLGHGEIELILQMNIQ